jgi:hypothetical protein
MGFILSLIAYVLFPIAALINFFVVMYKNIRVKGFFKTMNGYWFQNALEIDIYTNWHFRTTWNTLFRKKDGYAFGKKGETISSALGKNQKAKKLSVPGWILVVILYIIDYKYWGKGGHCLNAIKE